MILKIIILPSKNCPPWTIWSKFIEQFSRSKMSSRRHHCIGKDEGKMLIAREILWLPEYLLMFNEMFETTKHQWKDHGI
jgi:hypothetical protein